MYQSKATGEQMKRGMDLSTWVVEAGELLSVTPAWVESKTLSKGRSYQDSGNWSSPGLSENWVGFTAGGQTPGLKSLLAT